MNLGFGQRNLIPGICGEFLLVCSGTDVVKDMIFFICTPKPADIGVGKYRVASGVQKRIQLLCIV